MTLTELLSDLGMPENEFLDAVRRGIDSRPRAATARLSDHDAQFLREHSGLPNEAEVAATVSDVESETANILDQRSASLSVDEAAHLLGVDQSRVRHRLRDRALYGFKLGSTLRVAKWQFDGDRPIPGLRSLVAAVPPRLHPIAMSNFMTRPDPDFAVDDQPRSPRDWLVGGGDVAVVVEYLQALDAW